MTTAPPDFLDRLVDKTFGQQTAIDPRLPSMFEPRTGGLALEREESAAETDATIPRRDGQSEAAGDSVHPAPARRGMRSDAPATRRNADAHAAAGREPERGIPTRLPISFSETVEPEGADASPDGGSRADIDSAGKADLSWRQTAALRPHAADRAPATVTVRDLPEVENSDVGPAGAAPPHRPVERKRPVAAPGEHDVRQRTAATPSAMHDPDAMLQIEMADRPTATLQRTGGEIAVVRPTAERGAMPPRTAAPQPFPSERHAPPHDNASFPHGALLPVALPPQRAAFASSPTAQRRGQTAPPHGEAHETPPSVVNVTIGRVEVRAATGAAPRGSEKREPRPLSLADYLKRRSER